MNDDRARDLSSAALLENSAWIRSLAHRMVADASRADDLAQDTWMRAASRSSDSPRAVYAWLRTVMRNLVRRSYRSDQRRIARERRAARPERVESGAEELLERVELQRQVTSVVLELREPYRSTVLLRYFEDVPTDEIAARHEVSPATVRSRLNRAHAELRVRLESTGWAVLASPFAGAPKGVISTALTTTTLKCATASLSETGVLIMSQKTAWTAVACALIGGVAGWGLTFPSDESVGSYGDELSAAIAALESDLHLAREKVSIATARGDRIAAENETLRTQLDALTRVTSVEEPTIEPGAENVEDLAAESKLDWESVAKAIAGASEVLQKDYRARTPAEGAKIAALYARLLELSATAKTLSERPLLQPGFLTDLASAVFGGTLDLDDAQRTELRDLTSEIEAGLPKEDELTPIERYRLRSDIVAHLHDGLEAILDEDQLTAWPKVETFSDQLLQYDGSLILGIESSSSRFIGTWLSNAIRVTGR